MSTSAGFERAVTKKYSLEAATLVTSDCREDSFGGAGGVEPQLQVGVLDMGSKEVTTVRINFV